MAAVEIRGALPGESLNAPLVDHDDVGCFAGCTPKPGTFFGKKTIGVFGAIVLVMNNVTGPGMLTLPALYQTAGWLPTTLSCVFVATVSALAATLFCDSIALMPENRDFKRRIEFCEPYKFHFGERTELVMHIAFYLTLLCQNVAAIVEVAQVMDSLIAWGFGRSWGIEFMPKTRVVTWDISTCTGSGSCIPFDTVRHVMDIGGDSVNYGLILTLGYVVTFFVLMPIGLLTLDENIPFQIFSWAALILGMIEFVAQFSLHGLVRDRVPVIGDEWASVVGIVLFNFSFSVTLPSLINEMKTSVPITRVIWGSVGVSTVMYIFLGLFGGMAYSSVSPNMLTTLSSPAEPPLTRISAYLFACVSVGARERERASDSRSRTHALPHVDASLS